MSKPSVFGEIKRNPPGTPYVGREEVRLAGLHRHGQAGISGNVDEGADAIIVSGGYVDDEDHGDWIIYTGHGGQDESKRQVRDQTLTSGNLALVRSGDRGLPVRVIRGSNGDKAHSPASGYRYDGLFAVTEHWVESSVDGPQIFRYLLEELDHQGPWTSTGQGASQPGTPGAPPAGNSTPGTRPSVSQRIIRNTAVTQYVKELYDYTCQFCGIRLEVDAGAYAEGAHIRPLGGRHRGADQTTNVLCLCPNDHVLFDKGGLYVDGSQQVIVKSTGIVKTTLDLKPGHLIDVQNIDYHREHIAAIKKP